MGRVEVHDVMFDSCKPQPVDTNGKPYFTMFMTTVKGESLVAQFWPHSCCVVGEFHDITTHVGRAGRVRLRRDDSDTWWCCERFTPIQALKKLSEVSAIPSKQKQHLERLFMSLKDLDGMSQLVKVMKKEKGRWCTRDTLISPLSGGLRRSVPDEEFSRLMSLLYSKCREAGSPMKSLLHIDEPKTGDVKAMTRYRLVRKEKETKADGQIGLLGGN